MLKRLRLKNFKNFEDAELSLGPFTLLVGANASGKSNIREALRFLHAVGREYSLAEILGGKYGAGEKQWDGIRGGLKEASFRGAGTFELELEIDLSSDRPSHAASKPIRRRFSIEVATGAPPYVVSEALRPVDAEGNLGAYYETRGSRDARPTDPIDAWSASYGPRAFRRATPLLTQWTYAEGEDLFVPWDVVHETMFELHFMRFFDLSPDAMREPSIPGQRGLSDRGDNLSSVLHSLCADELTKRQIIDWLRLLTPMDVDDLRFESDVRGHVILMIVEKDGHAYSAYSASDGTLRFLGVLAALFSPEPGLFFLEEIENGLHPTRIRLLLDLIRSRTQEAGIQVVATTHSPTVLSLLSVDELKDASLVYRLEGEPSARITKVLDVPDAERVLATHDRGELLASGWFEGMVEFAAAPHDPPAGSAAPSGAAA